MSATHIRLGRNSLMNLAGHGLPALIGIATLPVLIHGLGTELFGVLSLVWVIIAYFSLLDLGMARAMTRALADSLGAERTHEIPAYATAGVLFMLLMGAVGAGAAYGLAPWLAQDALRLPAPILAESVLAFRVLALALPFIVSAPGLQAILIAHGRFDVVNLLRVPIVSLSFLLPVAALAISPTLVAVTMAAAAAHCIGWVAYWIACLRAVPSLRAPRLPVRAQVIHLLSYGGWLTISNVIAPLMLYLDRFLIARIVSPAGVAYYTTPFAVVTQLWIVPRAVIEALFPTLVTDFGGGTGRARATYYRGLAYVMAVLAPVAAVVVLGARPALALWIGEDFAAGSFRVAQILAVGVLVNAVGLVATAVIQAAGRPDITAKLHMAEAPLYFTYLLLLLTRYGIVGAAIAWLVRVSISAIALAVFAHRCLNTHTSFIRPAAAEATPIVAEGSLIA